MAALPTYVVGSQLCAADYKNHLGGPIFWYKPPTGSLVLVKIYKRNGGPARAPSVAVMHAYTHDHIAYTSIKRLFFAFASVTDEQDMFCRLFADIRSKAFSSSSDESSDD